MSFYLFSASSIVYSFQSGQKDTLHGSIPSYSEQRSKPLSWLKGPKYCHQHDDLISCHPCPPSSSCSTLFCSSDLPAHSHCKALPLDILWYFLSLNPHNHVLWWLLSSLGRWESEEWRICKVLRKSVQLLPGKIALTSRSLWWLILYSFYHRNFLVSHPTSAALSFGSPIWVTYLGLSLFTWEMGLQCRYFQSFDRFSCSVTPWLWKGPQQCSTWE